MTKIGTYKMTNTGLLKTFNPEKLTNLEELKMINHGSSKFWRNLRRNYGEHRADQFLNCRTARMEVKRINWKDNMQRDV
jgi:hypothetical protein